MSVELECDICGEVVLPANRIICYIRPTTGIHGPHEAFLSFDCPECGVGRNNDVCMCVVGSVGRNCARVVQLEPEWHDPALPLLTLDDAIDFHTALEKL